MMETAMTDGHARTVEGKGSLRRVATARAVRALRLLRRLGVSAKVVGSLADGRFSEYSDVDFLVSHCPHPLKYAIEGRVEDVMRGIPFDVVYGDEAKERVLRCMESHAVDDRALSATLDRQNAPDSA